MDFNTHSVNLAGSHAFLSPSNYSWTNYDEEKLARVWFMQMQAKRGSELHAFAHQAIKLGIKLPEANLTMNLYVNDAIGFRMTPEQCLYYSMNCYGHADCISFRNNKLRIHDLKTGITETSMKQLEIYAALYCLEYKVRPFDIEIELRIYQNDSIVVLIPDTNGKDDIFHLMEKIKFYDKLINEFRLEALS